MDLATLLVEIPRRARVLPPPQLDPMQEIHRRCAEAPDTPENRTLVRIAAAIA